MDVVVGDLLRIAVAARYNNQVDVINVFHVKCNSVGQSADAIGVAQGLFQHCYVGGVIPYISTVVRFTTLKIERMSPLYMPLAGIDVSVQPSFAGVGTSAGDPMPPQDTMTIRQFRPDSTMRHGYKRFSGLTEPSQNLGLLVEAPTALQVIADKFYGVFRSGHFTVGNWNPDEQSEYIHVGVQQFSNGLALNPVNVAPFVGAQVNAAVGSQNSRKYGRGN